MLSCSSKLAFVSQNDDNLERRESVNLRYTQSAVEVDMANGKVMRIPHASIKNKQQINITEVFSYFQGHIKGQQVPSLHKLLVVVPTPYMK